MERWIRKKGNYIRTVCLAFLVLLVAVCWQNLNTSGDAPALREVMEHLKGNLYRKALDVHMPAVAAASGENRDRPLWGFFLERILSALPIQSYTMSLIEYDTQPESQLSYEMLMAREGVDEQYRDGELVAEGETAGAGEAAGNGTEGSGAGSGMAGNGTEGNGAGSGMAGNGMEGSGAGTEGGIAAGAAGTEGGIAAGAAGTEGGIAAGAQGEPFVPATEPVVQISREKLNDFDYLLQHFYVVDKTTTIDSSLLNAMELLAMNMKLSTGAEQPQILIHHTHSLEGYADSTGDPSTSIVGVGEYLAQLLQERYGFNVIHDTGAYDVEDHQNAYAHAGPAIERILAENPSIEVVIDMHRDGIKEGHLVTDLNGKQTAKIMFFNGLSRTTKNGNLDYLYNPYLKENLALSLQMKLAAEEYYPGFARSNYLKGYRYNLHYAPKSMLIEVGAQTNTVQEAMNAMEPLADLLYKVLAP